MFDPPAVKELRKQAEFVGGLHGQAYLGDIPAGDVANLVADPSWKAKMHDAFTAASAAVGEQKARKAAVRAARLGAESYARLGSGDVRHPMQQAEQSLTQMLAG